MIALKPHQVDHVSKLVNILLDGNFALDLSVMGAGKTFTAAAFFFKHIVVVCPLSVVTKWMEIAALQQVPLSSIFSYQTLRSSKGRQPKHGLLKRLEEQVRSFRDCFERLRCKFVEQSIVTAGGCWRAGVHARQL